MEFLFLHTQRKSQCAKEYYHYNSSEYIALAFDTNITPELVERALDLPNYDDYFNLLNALVRKDNAEITTIVDTVYNSGTNFIKWFEGFHSFLYYYRR